MSSARWRLLLAGVALTALSTLLIELALTRLFSVLLYYHFAFMAISVALLGLGAGGLFSYWIVGEGPLELLWARLARLAAANALLTVVVLAVLLRTSVSLSVSASNLLRLAVIYFVSAAPFFFSGAILSVVLARLPARAGAVYGADLAGASAGALLLIPLLNELGGPNTVLFAAAVIAASACVWAALGARDVAPHGWRRWAALPLVLALALAANLRFRFLDVKYAKGREPERELYSRWNSFSRVTLHESKQGLYILIDADAETGIPGIPLSDRKFWEKETGRYGAGLAYVLHPGASALVIGSGGGYDVARALSAGSHAVTAVEINPIIVNDLMLGKLLEASHSLYRRPEVRVFVEDGRSFVRRSPERYGVIQATLVDTWAASAAGAFALTENNLYTVEAFREYLRHLEPDGILSITRWEFPEPREALRVVALGLEALREEGASLDVAGSVVAAKGASLDVDPPKHFVVVADSRLGPTGTPTTVLLKRSPFTPEEIETVRRTAAGTGSMKALYLPGDCAHTAFGEMICAGDPADYQRRYAFDITPVHDNRPFFFFNVRLSDLFRLARGHESMDWKVNLGLLLLLGLLAISGVAVLLFLLLPARLSARLPRGPGVSSWLLYFVAIGLGYILVEVALIQKFVLFLGHPTYALTVAVFWLLAASGAGSLWSRGFAEDGLAHRLSKLLVGAAALIALLALAATPVLAALVAWPLPARVGLTAALLAPAGFLMGTAFPTGLRLAGRAYPEALQWAWAMNAAASVLGSGLAVFVSIHSGIWQTLALGGTCYLAAAVFAVSGDARAGSRTAALSCLRPEV